MSARINSGDTILVPAKVMRFVRKRDIMGLKLSSTRWLYQPVS